MAKTAYYDSLSGPLKVKVLSQTSDHATVMVLATGGCFSAFSPYPNGSTHTLPLENLWQKCKPLGRFGTRYEFSGRFQTLITVTK